MKSHFPFKGFWLPFIIFNIAIITTVTLTQSMDSVYGFFIIGFFYAYNKGFKNAQKNNSTGG